mgnify:CR=1 FL=1
MDAKKLVKIEEGKMETTTNEEKMNVTKIVDEIKTRLEEQKKEIVKGLSENIESFIKNERIGEEEVVENNGTLVRFDSVEKEYVELRGMRHDISATKGVSQLIMNIFYWNIVEVK